LQRELLRTCRIGLHERELDPLDSLRLLKDKSDRLLAELDSAPTMPIFLKCGFDWIPRIFGSRFDPGEGLHIKPGCFLFWQYWTRVR
jgi:hypothetical protein